MIRRLFTATSALSLVMCKVMRLSTVSAGVVLIGLLAIAAGCATNARSGETNDGSAPIVRIIEEIYDHDKALEIGDTLVRADGSYSHIESFPAEGAPRLMNGQLPPDILRQLKHDIELRQDRIDRAEPPPYLPLRRRS